MFSDAQRRPVMRDLLIFCAGALCGVAVFIGGVWFGLDHFKKEARNG